jgi:hypothetical protein
VSEYVLLPAIVEEIIFRGIPGVFFGYDGVFGGSIIWLLIHPLDRYYQGKKIFT